MGSFFSVAKDTIHQYQVPYLSRDWDHIFVLCRGVIVDPFSTALSKKQASNSCPKRFPPNCAQDGSAVLKGLNGHTAAPLSQHASPIHTVETLSLAFSLSP